MTKAELQAERQKLKPEREVQKEIRAWLRSTGRPYTISDATKTLNVYGKQVQRIVSGWPDLTTITGTNARMFCIEVKKPYRGLLSREQALRLRQLHAHGVLICIARSLDDVLDAERNGVRASDLAEIAKTLAKPVKGAYSYKLIDSETGF